MIREFARAKLNLFLHVLGRGADGYHALESLMVFAEAADEVWVQRADALSLSISGPFAAEVPADETNLVLKAARALQAACGVQEGAKIHLVKHLPVASGIGGGSADAAAALRALSRLWRVELSAPALHALALTLGADVPACLGSAPVLARGRGEVLSPFPLPSTLHMVLVNPRVSVATADVFRAFSGPYDAPQEYDVPKDFTALTALLSRTRNSLEQAACAIAPAIAACVNALEAQEACAFARMSGSGGTCFGMFETDAQARAAAIHIHAAQPHWWVQQTTVKESYDQAQ